MNLKTKNQSLPKFSVTFFGVVTIAGGVLYYLYDSHLIGGLGLSSSVLSVVSCFHFFKRRPSDGKVESKLTVLLISLCVLGVGIIFMNKYSNVDSSFIYGLGGGVSMISGIAYVLESLCNFQDGVR